jgi:signal transduction histidine kinase
MGLGLYIVKLLVESQGGSVRLELPADGGTEVVMTLPIADAEE